MRTSRTRFVWAGLASIVACGIAVVASAQTTTRTIRVVCYNIQADTIGIATPGITTPTCGLIAPFNGAGGSFGTNCTGSVTNGGVLEGIGEEIVAGDPAQPIDILALEETTSNTTTVQPIVDGLNAFYAYYGIPAGYAMSPYQATESGGNPTFGNGPNALVYNTNTVQLLQSAPVDPPGGTSQLGSASGEYREVMRYEFAPAGVPPSTNNEFYIYVSHYKASSGTQNDAYRLGEASIIRNDESVNVPPNSRVLYVGDYNPDDNSGEAGYQTICSNSAPDGIQQGQGVDPLNILWGPYTSASATINWSSSTTSTQILFMLSEESYELRYRDDLQVMTHDVYYDVAGGLAYVQGTYHSFGNNASIPWGSSVSASGNTALNDLDPALTNLTGLSAAVLLEDLTGASDHLPVVADYSIPLGSGTTWSVSSYLITTSSSPPAGGSTSGGGRTPVWSDEFNGTNLDLTKWTFDTGGGGWGNNELEYYTSRTNNAYVSGGMLHIRAQIEGTNGYHYTSARMKTQGLFAKKYGRIEWRAKLPAGTGMWPALWTLGTNVDSVGWPACGEIDVIESDGADPTFVQGSLHWGGDTTGIYNFTGGDSVTNFHVYDLDWTSDSIDWSVDGVVYQTQTSWVGSTTAFNNPEFFLMNLAVGGNYVGNPDTNSINPSLPAEMLIDYMRVYDYVGPAGTGGVYSSGSNVTVCATASPCYSFVNWTDQNSNIVSTSACYSFTPVGPVGYQTLVANFAPISSYTITTSSSPSAGGSSSGGGMVACASFARVCATPNACYSFVNWTDQNSNIVSTSACYTFAPNGNENLVANFAPISYTVSTSSSPAAGGSTSGGGTVACGSGSNVTVCASANAPCYSFANWTLNGNVVSTSACYSSTVPGNETLMANFTPLIYYTVSTSSSPAAGGSTSGGGTVACGLTETVCATPNGCYSFVNWTDQNSNVVSTSACYSFPAASNETLVANFAMAGSISGSLATLYSFSYSDGAYPYGALVQSSDGNFYGTTYQGGTSGYGTVFQISSSGSLTILHSFSYSDGSYPQGGLVQGSDGKFYGTTVDGGTSGDGTVFRISSSGSLTTLYSFSYSEGAYPEAGLVQGSDGNFYGTTYYGGTSGYGTVFRISSSGSLTTLYSFSYSDGAYPEAALVQGSDGNLYGTTYQGGTSGYGTVFRISSSGSLTTLYSFSYSDGSYPYAGLVQGSDSNFYGTTSQGGASGVGTAFRISPGGNLTTLWSFTGCTDGSYPHAGLVQGSDGNFYGTTPYGGMDDAGTVFLLTAGGSLTTLYSFSYGDGANPYAGLVQGSDSNLYGTTANGGTSGDGTVFRIASGLCGYLFTPNAASFGSTGGSGSVTVTASTTNCAWTASSNSGFITITSGSGGTGSGTVSYTVAADTDTNNFGRSGTMTIAGRTFTVAQASLGCSFTLDSTNASFDAAGGSGSVTVSVSGSDCAWTATSDSDFITITSGGGSGGNGTVNYTVAANTNSFPLTGTMTIAGRTFTVTQGGFGCSALLTVSTSPVGGGTTSGGGTVGCGSNVTVCATPNSCYSFANWTLNGSVVSRLACDSFAVAGDETLVANFATAGLTGSSLTALHSFSYSDGAYPSAGLVQGSDGYLYGTTANGGTDGYGTVFRITSSGSLATLYSFSFSDGAYPKGGLVQGTDGNFYGTTSYAGPSGYGTVFRITAGGTLTTLYSFSYNDGAYPDAGLVQGIDGNFYGTTSSGGTGGDGTVFQITAGGTLTTLHSFSYSDGAYPNAGLVRGTDGNFYGTTSYAGPSGYGTVFRITAGGTLTTLYSFSYSDGAYPQAGLVQGTDGNFYGTTYQGGPSGVGTVFRISPGGGLTTLWSFTGCTDGSYPHAELVQGSDGNFYGTTQLGGPSGDGAMFRITTNDDLTTLWQFCSVQDGSGDCLDGAYPEATLLQGSDGTLYGTTSYGGPSGYGTLFQLILPCTITTSSSPASGGGTTGGGTYDCGSSVMVCATPNACYSFVNWTDQNSNVVSTSACWTVTADGNVSLVANFAPISYTITTSSSPAAGGSTSGGGTVACGSGSNVTVCASANVPYYVFANWTLNGNMVSMSACYTFTPTNSETLVANFALVDSVGDGIPDIWRQSYFGGGGATTNQLSCAACDADGTGQNNLFKYVTGLDPTNPASVFLLQIASATNGLALFFSPLASGRTYTPQVSTDSVSGVWLPLTMFVGPVTNGNQISVTDTCATQPVKFYRIDISLP